MVCLTHFSLKKWEGNKNTRILNTKEVNVANNAVLDTAVDILACSKN